MVQKRPGEEFGDSSLKQPRYLTPDDGAVLDFDILGENFHQVQHDLGVHDRPTKDEQQCNKRLHECHVADSEVMTFTGKGIETIAPGSLSNSSLTISTTSKEDNASGAAYHILLSPEYYNLEYPVNIVLHPEDLYHSLLEWPPQKLVPLGTEFQAELPECGRDSNRKSSNFFVDTCEASCLPSHSLESDVLGSSNEYDRLAGTCMIPMPVPDVVGDDGAKPGSGRTECSCDDIGSIRCVKQHIEEARLMLRMTVGTETFHKLGFDDMGEVVAEKWSKEEEEIFYEVIFSHPASQGMNFWDHLTTAFPSRAKREIVSFYFNVFILRKRAEQNRSDLSNIDSDNDEVEAGMLSTEKVVGNVNEDSDFEPVSEGAVIIANGIYEENMSGNEVVPENSRETANENFSRNDVIDHAPEKSSRDVVGNLISSPLSEGVICNKIDGHDAQNGDFTLFDRGDFAQGFLHGASVIYDVPELDSSEAQNGTCNVHFEEQPCHKYDNSISTEYEYGWPPAESSEMGNWNKNSSCCSCVKSNRDGHLPDLQAFPNN